MTHYSDGDHLASRKFGGNVVIRFDLLETPKARIATIKESLTDDKVVNAQRMYTVEIGGI